MLANHIHIPTSPPQVYSSLSSSGRGVTVGVANYVIFSVKVMLDDSRKETQ